MKYCGIAIGGMFDMGMLGMFGMFGILGMLGIFAMFGMLGMFRKLGKNIGCIKYGILVEIEVVGAEGVEG